jgi:hypothetical protein
MEDFATLYMLLLGYAPTVIASIVGIALALVLWPTVRTAAILMLIAGVLQLLITSTNVGLYGWYMPHAIQAQNGGYASMRLFMGIWGTVSGLIHAIVLVLLFCSAFVGRRKASASGH